MPKLFRLADLTFMIAPILIIGMIVVAVGWNLVSAEGESLPIGAWVVAVANVIGTVAVVVAFYVQRWLWVRTYLYTAMGVHYFYEEGAKKYLRVSIEQDILRTLELWHGYYEARGEDVSKLKLIDAGTYIRGIVCLFKKEATWVHTAPGWWTRKVTGLAFENTIIVGQGDRMIKNTAHAHELSHIHISRYGGRRVPEDESHEIFKDVRV